MVRRNIVNFQLAMSKLKLVRCDEVVTDKIIVEKKYYGNKITQKSANDVMKPTVG